MTKVSGYRAYNMNITSELDVLGGIACERALANPEISIALGKVTTNTSNVVKGPYSRSDSGLLFDAAGIARYLARSPRELIVEPYAGSEMQRISQLLVATALPMLMWMRGGIVLHAAGIIPAGRTGAIAIAGPSGIGKSTLAYRLIQAGGQIVGDDTLWLTQQNGAAVVSGISGSLFLADRNVDTRSEIAIMPQSRLETAHLNALFVLYPCVGMDSAEPERLRGGDAIEAFLRNRHRPKIPAILGQEMTLLPQCILHCRTLPIYRIPVKSGDIAGSQQHITSIVATDIGAA